MTDTFMPGSEHPHKWRRAERPLLSLSHQLYQSVKGGLPKLVRKWNSTSSLDDVLILGRRDESGNISRSNLTATIAPDPSIQIHQHLAGLGRQDSETGFCCFQDLRHHGEHREVILWLACQTVSLYVVPVLQLIDWPLQGFTDCANG